LATYWVSKQTLHLGTVPAAGLCSLWVPQVFSKEELKVVAELCQQHDVLCITDEVYQWLVYDGNQHISIGELCRGPFPAHLEQVPIWEAAWAWC
jgi:hypothetical protein